MAGGRRVTEARVRVLALALIYGDAEKPAESGGSEAPRAISRKTVCTCDQKPCSCPKGDVNYAFLHATGKGGSRETLLGPAHSCQPGMDSVSPTGRFELETSSPGGHR